MTLRITPARRFETRRLARILAAGRGVRVDRADRASLESLIKRGEVHCLRGWADTPLGFIALSSGVIHALYVAPRVQGRGIGARLMAHAKRAHDRLELWTPQANESARRFYLRQGFYPSAFSTGAGNDDHAPDIRMTWVRNSA